MFKDHFSGHAADYAQYRPHYPPELSDRVGHGGAGAALVRFRRVFCGSKAGFVRGRYDRDLVL